MKPCSGTAHRSADDTIERRPPPKEWPKSREETPSEGLQRSDAGAIALLQCDNRWCGAGFLAAGRLSISRVGLLTQTSLTSGPHRTPCRFGTKA